MRDGVDTGCIGFIHKGFESRWANEVKLRPKHGVKFRIKLVGVREAHTCKLDTNVI